MSNDKFLVYFLLIVVYMIYARVADVPPHGVEQGQVIASMPAPPAERGTGAPQ